MVEQISRSWNKQSKTNPLHQMAQFHQDDGADQQHQHPTNGKGNTGKQQPKRLDRILTNCSKKIMPGNSHNAATIRAMPTSLLPPPISAKICAKSC